MQSSYVYSAQENTKRGEKMTQKLTTIALVLLIIGLVVGGIIGYITGISQVSPPSNHEGNSLADQISQLQTQIASLQTENQMLKHNISDLNTEIQRLRANHNYTVGAVLTTLNGGYEDKTGPLFHVPTGHIKIVVELVSLGTIKGFWLDLYKVGYTPHVWDGHTENDGTWINYVYSLNEGDYYLEVGSVNFEWQITVYVYS